MWLFKREVRFASRETPRILKTWNDNLHDSSQQLRTNEPDDETILEPIQRSEMYVELEVPTIE
jgi:hypothetical protein